jgi:hypothetical protein
MASINRNPHALAAVGASEKHVPAKNNSEATSPTPFAAQASSGALSAESIAASCTPHAGDGSADLIIAEWPLNRREHLRVTLQRYRGVELIAVRKWFFGDDDTLRPGNGGITLNVKHLPQLTDALAKALAEARARGLVTAADEGAPS